MSRRRVHCAVMTHAAVVLLHVWPTQAAEPVYPGKQWATTTPDESGMDAAQLEKARDYALTGGGAGYITRHGKLVMTWGDWKFATSFGYPTFLNFGKNYAGARETSCLPTKWISDDGRTVYLVFSGDDAFSVRKGTLTVAE